MPIVTLTIIALLLAVLVLQIILLQRQRAVDADALERALREEQRTGRAELREQIEALRGSLTDEARHSRQESAEQQQRFADTQGARLTELTQRNEQRIGEMRTTLEQQLERLREDNSGKLEQMRLTVDEKLQSTLNTRLDASFKLVSERLEQVQRGLGEMQQLATGVGDLKRVLSNVKTRGSWGEVQLDRILDETLTTEQYAASVQVRPGSGERVDFACPDAMPEMFRYGCPSTPNSRARITNACWTPRRRAMANRSKPPPHNSNARSASRPNRLRANTSSRRTPPILPCCFYRPKAYMRKSCAVRG